MAYGKKSPSMGTPSIYSHVTSRSNANLRPARSVKSIKIPWYRKKILSHVYTLNIQRASMLVAIYSLCLSIFTIFTQMFDIYCLAQATPGITHYGYRFISYEFVYVGNRHVRNALAVFALFSILGGLVLFVTSIILIKALRREHEKRMVPWILSFLVFTGLRILMYIFYCIVNDLIFSYNIMMCILWTLFSIASIYGWLVVYSLYIELSDLTKLEDLAHLRIGTMQSLNNSTVHSIAGSRPTTPHSTVSTMPVN